MDVTQDDKNNPIIASEAEQIFMFNDHMKLFLLTEDIECPCYLNDHFLDLISIMAMETCNSSLTPAGEDEERSL